MLQTTYIYQQSKSNAKLIFSFPYLYLYYTPLHRKMQAFTIKKYKFFK